MSEPTVLWVDELDPVGAVSLAGGKIGRLAELARAGIAVPRGFVVTTAAYRACVNAGLGETIGEEFAAGIDPGNLARVELLSERVRQSFESISLAEPLASGLTGAYEELCYRCRHVDVPVAVRSSATGEDLPGASAAGQHDSYLGVSGSGEVLAAVKRCWGSLFSARAVLYRLAKGISHHDSPMAVGVLELVPARASGVAFSIHPVTGRRDRMVIEGSWGWGEAVVQGLVTPDHVEVGKSDGRILRHDVADKAVVSTFDYRTGRVIETEMPNRFRGAPTLDEEEIRVVADTVLRIEEYYGHPVDVEWVIDRHRRPGEPVIIVQTRPETVHAAAEEQATSPGWDPVAFAGKYAFGRRKQ